MTAHWYDGNHIRLLENGEEFFPRVFECIAQAQKEVVIETFILWDDKVGQELHAALVAAAGRGVQVDLTIDGFGSSELSDDFIGSLHAAGVRVHVFDPASPLFLRFKWRVNYLRRMHRKIVVIDGATAFVGGINYSGDHLADYGPQAKQDYAVEIEGPVVAEIHRFTHTALAQGQRHQRRRYWWRRRKHVRSSPDALPRVGPAQVQFVVRDNREHPDDIERYYRAAIRVARRRVVIANAYFFPGYRLVRELRRAARRGVDVRLILQGMPDMPIVKTGASMLYHHLLKAGVRIYEYGDRPLHGKVALADEEWSTVGSSNLDPLSLVLNLEANVLIRDPGFNQVLHDTLDRLMQKSCRQIQLADLGEASAWGLLRSYIAFHLIRKYPGWFSWLPLHVPRLAPALQDELLPARGTAFKDDHGQTAGG